MNLEQIPERYRKRISVDSNGCWIWTGAKHRRGYGMVNICRKVMTVHSFLFELLVGPVPDGMQLHHKCEVPQCCNPDHLQIVNALDHRRAHWRTHCLRGHELTADNTILGRNGLRQCRKCRDAANRKWHDLNRQYRRETRRIWRQENRDMVNASKRKYDAEHREKVRAQKRASYHRNKEKTYGQ
jgi:Spy/CpxP family protein refolding chaperone